MFVEPPPPPFVELNQIGVIHIKWIFNIVPLYIYVDIDVFLYTTLLTFYHARRGKKPKERSHVVPRYNARVYVYMRICNPSPLFKPVKIRATTEIRVTPRKQPCRVRPLSTRHIIVRCNQAWKYENALTPDSSLSFSIANFVFHRECSIFRRLCSPYSHFANFSSPFIPRLIFVVNMSDNNSATIEYTLILWARPWFLLNSYQHVAGYTVAQKPRTIRFARVILSLLCRPTFKKETRLIVLRLRFRVGNTFLMGTFVRKSINNFYRRQMSEEGPRFTRNVI